MAYFARIQLPFAEFIASASWSGGEVNQNIFQLRRCTPVPRLPPGMSVEAVVALVGNVFSTHPIHDFKFTLQFSSDVRRGGPENGEGLSAQSFYINDSCLMIGTEDDEFLASRLNWWQWNRESDPVGYLPNGFELSFASIPPHATLDFHFVIAFNSKASDGNSEWFAVDIPHESLLNLDSSVVLVQTDESQRSA